MTNFISKSLLDRTLSYSEHLDFAPVTEEFAYYVADWRKTNDPTEATMDQAKTLIEFGMQYDILNKQFWTVLVDIVLANFSVEIKDFDEVMTVVTLLKDQGMLKNKILRRIPEMAVNASKMTPGELTFYTQVYFSEEMQSSVSPSKENQDLVMKALLANVENFTVEEFAHIANAAAFVYNQEYDTKFDEFLCHSAPLVLEWLQRGSIQQINTLIQIIQAYSESQIPEEKLP